MYGWIDRKIIKHRIKKIILMMFFLCTTYTCLAAPVTHVHVKKVSKSHKTTQTTNKTKNKKPIKKYSTTHTQKKSRKPIKHHTTVKKHTKAQHASKRQSSKPVKTQTVIQKQNVATSSVPTYSLSSIEKNLVGFVRNTIASLRYSVYQMGGTRIDTSRGVYIVDCSGYVDHILKSVYPQAYSSLVSSTGSEKPTTDDFYHYFTNLSASKNWNTIDDVEQLRPGDILVFRYKNSLGYERGGHVMVVMDKPVRNADTFLVRVTDSASGGHTKDTRQPRTSGIGIGTLLLKVNPKTYQPYAYAWKVGSRWETNVNFAMARPIDIET